MRLWMNEPLKAHTTFQIGGPGGRTRRAGERGRTGSRCSRARRRWCWARGSNLLVRDAGVAGLTVLLGKDFARIEIEGETIFARRARGFRI